MAQVLLFTVEDVFQLTGRLGPVLVPGLSHGFRHPQLRIGAPLLVVRPDGSSLDTHLSSVEMPGWRGIPDNPTYAIALASTVSKDEIPIGSAVYLIVSEEGCQTPGGNTG